MGIRKQLFHFLSQSLYKLWNSKTFFPVIINPSKGLNDFKRNEDRIMSIKKSLPELLAKTLVYSLIVITIDFIVLFFLMEGLNQIVDSLSFVLLLEGGIGLTIGGATASYTPISAKISEVFFHTEPWNAKRQKEVEKQAVTIIGTGIVLVFSALLLSAL